MTLSGTTRGIMLNVVMLNVVMHNVVMLNVITLGVVKLNVVMLSVVAPQHAPISLHNFLSPLSLSHFLSFLSLSPFSQTLSHFLAVFSTDVYFPSRSPDKTINALKLFWSNFNF
jgi:hypothetical protein